MGRELSGGLRTDFGRLPRYLLGDDAATHVCPGISVWPTNVHLDGYVAERFAVLGVGHYCSHLFVEAIQFGQNWYGRETDVGKCASNAGRYSPPGVLVFAAWVLLTC